MSDDADIRDEPEGRFSTPARFASEVRPGRKETGRSPAAPRLPAAKRRESDPLMKVAQYVRGVGPRNAALLRKLKIETVGDLLYHLPRKYLDCSKIVPMNRARRSQFCTVRGNVIDAESRRTFSGKTITKFVLTDGTGAIAAAWFNAPYMARAMKEGDVVIMSGVVQFYDMAQMVAPDFEVLGTDEAGALGALKQAGKAGRSGDMTPGTPILPVYPSTEGLTQWRLRRIMSNALSPARKEVRDFLPPEMLRERKLPSLADALHKVHFPQKMKEAETARRRLVYDELFLMELVMALRHKALKKEDKTNRVTVTPEIDAHIRRLFPFELTSAQEKVIREISRDIESPKPMNRLLQGDVGSGKTVVALHAMLCYVANRCQAALMAPTEILAQQHYLTVRRFLAGSRVRILPLIGGMSKKERREKLAVISAGQPDIVIGTHALVQEDVNFAKLGIIIVDEQHKFGVLQRGSLIKKGVNPDVLIMTATPIPRTLAMTVFGDLDVSIIDKMPPGRKRIKTWWVPRRKMRDAYDFIRDKIRKGRQAYFVYPLVEESKNEQTKRLRAATEMAKLLAEEVFPEFKVALLHGRMSSEEKDSVMHAFRDGKIQVLVSTIVIEVGIDVPNATMMVIENAERFGLSQLHQLRGRIGRGAEESYCILFGNPRTPEGKERLKIISRTSDGFKIAEEDLRVRGPGEFFGTRQHGLPELKVANLIEDYDILRMARKDAFSIARQRAVTAGGQSVRVEATHYNMMLDAVRDRFADMVELIGVG